MQTFFTRPCSRRSWLSGMAASSILWPTAVKAAVSNRQAVHLAVISDTHLGYRDQEAAARQWERTAAALRDSKAEFVLHLGDIVDGGREAQYPRYVKTRETIGKPVYEIPGNHDPRELFQKYLRATVDTIVDHQWLKFLLVGNAHVDSHDGFLTNDQIEWIDEQCAAATREDRFAIVCMHVPAHTNWHPDRGWYVKTDDGQTALYKVLTRHAPRVLALWHGHFHNGVRGWDDHAPLHEISFPSALYNQDRKLVAQSAPGYNLDEFRPGYTVVSLDGDGLQLQLLPTAAPNEKAEKLLSCPQLAAR